MENGFMLVSSDDVAQESVNYSEISSAKLTEDTRERYCIELFFSDDRYPKATLIVRSSIYFLLVFAAFANSEVPCDFSFTKTRLRALGAGR